MQKKLKRVRRLHIFGKHSNKAAALYLDCQILTLQYFLQIYSLEVLLTICLFNSDFYVKFLVIKLLWQLNVFLIIYMMHFEF